MNISSDTTTYESNMAISVIVGVFLIVGSTGNVITMLVILKNKNLHTPSNYFIFSLCISDLISGIVCSPLWLYRRTWGFEQWDWGPELCKFYWAADFATNYATAMHILSFALLRCFAVHWPFRISSITKRKVVVYIGALWAIAIVMSIPLFWLMGVVDHHDRERQENGAYWPACSIYNNQNSSGGGVIPECCVTEYNTYMLVVSSVFFYVPEICVLFLSCFIARALVRRRRWRKSASSVYNVSEDVTTRRKLDNKTIPDVIPNSHARGDHSNREDAYRPSFYIGQTKSPTSPSGLYQSRSRCTLGYRAQNERNIFTQLSLVVVAFMIGYIPVTVYLVWTTATSSSDTTNGDVDYWFGVASYLCLRLSECMNPVMYNLGSSNIRSATKKLFKRES